MSQFAKIAILANLDQLVGSGEQKLDSASRKAVSHDDREVIIAYAVKTVLFSGRGRCAEMLGVLAPQAAS